MVQCCVEVSLVPCCGERGRCCYCCCSPGGGAVALWHVCILQAHALKLVPLPICSIFLPLIIISKHLNCSSTSNLQQQHQQHLLQLSWLLGVVWNSHVISYKSDLWRVRWRGWRCWWRWGPAPAPAWPGSWCSPSPPSSAWGCAASARAAPRHCSPPPGPGVLAQTPWRRVMSGGGKWGDRAPDGSQSQLSDLTPVTAALLLPHSILTVSL